MSRTGGSVGRRLDATWMGMLWVWMGVLWGFAAFRAGTGGGLWVACALGVRSIGTIALGIGLCAGERWAWAPAVCLTAFEAAVAIAGALGTAWILLTLSPYWLSWKPVFLGLTRPLVAQVMIGSGVVAALSGACAALLWSTRPTFDVPRRRHFTVLTQVGLLPAGVLLLVDAYLLKTWWLAVSS